MKITDLHVESFGAWRGLEIGDLPEQLTVFYGPNEAGKTTLLHFVRSMLYGFSPERWHRYLPSSPDGSDSDEAPRPTGGGLRIAAADGSYHVQRHAGQLESQGGMGELRVTTEAGARQGARIDLAHFCLESTSRSSTTYLRWD